VPPAQDQLLSRVGELEAEAAESKAALVERDGEIARLKVCNLIWMKGVFNATLIRCIIL
jgi:hypothetical protein